MINGFYKPHLEALYVKDSSGWYYPLNKFDLREILKDFSDKTHGWSALDVYTRDYNTAIPQEYLV